MQNQTIREKVETYFSPSKESCQKLKSILNGDGIITCTGIEHFLENYCAEEYVNIFDLKYWDVFNDNMKDQITVFCDNCDYKVNESFMSHCKCITFLCTDCFLDIYCDPVHNYCTDCGHKYKKINVYETYRDKLDKYGKNNFDVFVNGNERVLFDLHTGKFYSSENKNPKMDVIETTLGQLNMFRWLFSTGIIYYIENAFLGTYEILDECSQDSVFDNEYEFNHYIINDKVVGFVDHLNNQQKFVEDNEVYDCVMQYVSEKYGPVNYKKALEYLEKNSTMDEIKEDAEFENGVFVIKINDCKYKIYEKKTEYVDNGWVFENKIPQYSVEKVRTYYAFDDESY